MPLTIHKRGKTWHFRGTVAGRRLRGTTGTEDKAEASRFAANVEAREWKRSVDGPQAVLTFAQAAMLYRAAGKSTRFLEKVEDHWKDTLVRDISAGAIRQASIDLYPGCSAATRNRQGIVPTQAVINHAAEQELCPIIRVKRFPVEKKEPKYVTVAWVRKFAASAPPHMAALAWFMFQTGARISEALRVTWEDVDLKARTVRIQQTKTRSERTAHLPAESFAGIANQPRSRERVFFYKTRASGHHAWSGAVERAGLQKRSFHSCRHGFATGLLRAGHDPVTVADAGGWKTPRLVLDTYGHANKDRTITNALSGTKLTQPKAPVARKPVKIGKS